MNELNAWDKLIIKSLILSKEFDIHEVRNFEAIKSTMFDEEKYSSIKLLIAEQNWKSIQDISEENKIGFREYIDIIKFTDQLGQNYIATVYDNDALEQGPQIIDIFPLT